jgi:hypothetical protein
MYFTDRGIEELEARRGDEVVAVAWLAEQLRDFVNLNPAFETAVDRLAVFLARSDDDEDQLLQVPARPSSRCRAPGRPGRPGRDTTGHIRNSGRSRLVSQLPDLVFPGN